MEWPAPCEHGISRKRLAAIQRETRLDGSPNKMKCYVLRTRYNHALLNDNTVHSHPNFHRDTHDSHSIQKKSAQLDLWSHLSLATV